MRKRILLGSLVLIITVAIGTGVFFAIKKNQQGTSSTPEATISPTPPPSDLLTWDDPAGFTFVYPKGVSIDKHDEDGENYAHVEITHKDHPGSVIVWAKDTTAADVKAWVTTEKQFKGATVIDTTLGSQPAKKISLPQDKLIVGTVFDELLFMVDVTSTDKEYWTGVGDSIVNSFTFKPLESSASGDGSAGEAVDEEEVLQ